MFCCCCGCFCYLARLTEHLSSLVYTLHYGVYTYVTIIIIIIIIIIFFLDPR